MMKISLSRNGLKTALIISALSLLLAACGGDKIKPDADATADNPAVQQDQAGGAQVGGLGTEGGVGGTALEGGKIVSYEKNAINDPANVLSDKTIYFEFDSNTVGDDYVELVKHHGKYLSFNPDAKVVLEGNADERGSREYNVALGERRAQAVKDLMLYEGASNDQISIVSYGEEKPVAFGHDEESMRLNRRVEIVYQ